MNKKLIFSLLCCSILVSPGFAQEQRWFEVEMVIFTQTPEEPLQEQFFEVVTPIKPGRAFDLLTPLFQPNIAMLLKTLPLCEAVSTFDTEHGFHLVQQRNLCIHEPQAEIWQQSSLFEPRALITKLPYPSVMPSLITGNGNHQTTPYLAEDSALQFNELVSKLKRQRNKQVLLHTSWRQAPVTERLAIASHWFAGKNYSEQFDYWGQPVPAAPEMNLQSVNMSEIAQLEFTLQPDAPLNSDNQLLTNIDTLLQQLSVNSQLTVAENQPLSEPEATDALAQRNLPTEVWQLDGLFKLHLDHYLFVNTEFNLRLPHEDKLQTIYVRQSRRVISGEVHYLDHPYLGVLLQIRRYEPPLEGDELNEADSMLLTD